MPRPVHTPYDGSTHPFTIGLTPLDPSEWIEIDENLTEHLAEKDHHFSERHSDVFRAEPDTHHAQNEVLEMLWQHLPDRFPSTYTTTSTHITLHDTGRTYQREDFVARPLELAARLVQEDLVLMRPGENGHRLVAAALCFPSSWSLSNKFGLAMAEIHGPVPEFARGTRTATMIERIFTNLKTEHPVERFNWSLYDDPKLYYPESGHARAPHMWDPEKPQAWIRAERQTLRRLPGSGDILFTIKICVDPVEALHRHPDGKQLAHGLADQIAALNSDQVDYKGLGPTRDAAVQWLRSVSYR